MNWDETKPMVSIKDVYKSFGTLEVLKGVSLDVMKGEVICIIGPSGSGKSTLIRCINGLNDIQSGSILVEGQEVNDPELNKLELRKKVGMVFQQYNLFPHKTALQNVMMAPVRVLKQDKVKAEAAARAAAVCQDEAAEEAARLKAAYDLHVAQVALERLRAVGVGTYT